MTKNNGLIHVMTGKDIEEKIEQYLSVREEEKNKFGEVFTPIKLIEEMLDKLPKSVWINPDLKWLDPANGIGNFPMIVYQRLMKGLESWDSNNVTRSKHIIQNMLFMVEMNPANVKISKQIFGSTANICCADFLKTSEKCFSQFGINNFDIIIGNPPFQNDTSGETAQGKHDLYPLFVNYSFTILNDKGYLLFVTPPKWRAPDKTGNLSKMWDIFQQYNFIFLKIFSPDETNRIFNGINARVDYFLVQKSPSKSSTRIIDEENKEYNINMTKLPFIPNHDIQTIRNIITTESNGIKTIYSSSQYDKRKPHMSIKKTEQYKYPVRHSHTIKDGDINYWSKTKDVIEGKKYVQMFGVPKVILIKGLHPYPYNDYKGEYAMTNYSFGIPIQSESEGNKIVNAVNTNKFNKIIEATKWTSNFTDHNMFKYFKPDFYKYFLKDKQASKKTKNKKKSKKNMTRKCI